jgi:hypothetical protein
MEWHDSYTRSAGSWTNSHVASGHAVATLPPAVVGIAGGFIYKGASGNTNAPTKFDKRLGLGLLSSAALSTSLIYAGRSAGVEALKASSGTLPISEQRALKQTLDQGVAEPAQLLGDTLKWTPDQRAQFSRALRKKVMDTFVKTVQGMEFRFLWGETTHLASDSAWDDEGFEGAERVPIQPKLVANLNAIDFLELMESENLATKDEIAALRSIKALFERGQKIKDDMTPEVAKAILSEERAVGENMSHLARLHRLLGQVAKDLPDGSTAKRDAEKLFAESEKAMGTLKGLCDIGLE